MQRTSSIWRTAYWNLHIIALINSSRSVFHRIGVGLRKNSANCVIMPPTLDTARYSRLTSGFGSCLRRGQASARKTSDVHAFASHIPIKGAMNDGCPRFSLPARWDHTEYRRRSFVANTAADLLRNLSDESTQNPYPATRFRCRIRLQPRCINRS